MIDYFQDDLVFEILSQYFEEQLSSWTVILRGCRMTFVVSVVGVGGGIFSY